MDFINIAGRLLTGGTSIRALNIGTRLLYYDALRKLLLRMIYNRIQARLNKKEAIFNRPNKVEQQRKLMYLAILHTVDRVIKRRLVSQPVARKVAMLWSRALWFPPEKRSAVQRFHENYGLNPPWFITISPGHACNLKCQGCYANSGRSDVKLEWPILDRIITEAKQLWGIRFVVFSGGEPLIYHSAGKDILDIVERNPDLLFLMFTNGTLLNKEIATRLARLGNLTPAFSVEGMRKRTDDRRGTGVFDSVLNAIDHVREVGVPFGISVSVTRANYDEVLSDEFLDFFFDKFGAFYGFFFQYIPIGRKPDFRWVPTPAQRIRFWRRVWGIVEERKLFIVDFWNHGPLVKGCIAAGREGGYIYIDWNGKVMPCVFAPYSAGNIEEVYKHGGTLNDLWATPFFRAIRKWQCDYGYSQKELSVEANWLTPCPFRDHYTLFRRWIDRYQPEPEDESAQEALLDKEYYQCLVNYGSELKEITQEIWKKEYL